MHPLFQKALEGMDAETRQAVRAARAEIEPLLLDAVNVACSAWPELSCTPEVFAGHIGQQLGGRTSLEALREWFEYAHPEDLFLALCCARGDNSAIHAFSARYEKDIQALTGRFEDRTRSAQDLRQLLFEKLFVGEDARIASYAGLGFLQNWLRVTASRAFLDARRTGAQQKREQLLTEELSLEVMAANTGEDVELEFFKQKYSVEFKRAVASAIEALEPQQRVLLRQHVVERRSIDALGAIYGIHRSTAARRLEAAREAFCAQTRRALTEQLEVSASQLDSILALIRSRLDASVERLLAAEELDKRSS